MVARKPVGYQRDFPDAYRPNETYYLLESLRQQLHSALSENLLPNPADEGRIRQHAVDIGKSVYRPLSASAQIEDALDALLKKANKINDAFEQSFFMMVHLPYLQPFADINKRASRLAANLPLFRANLCPLAWRDFIKQTIHDVVTNTELDPLTTIQETVVEHIPESERSELQALIVEELRRLHEGVLARYGLRPSEFSTWNAAQKPSQN